MQVIDLLYVRVGRRVTFIGQNLVSMVGRLELC
jgi:hypothetical protein